jgi:hypothetical protein
MLLQRQCIITDLRKGSDLPVKKHHSPKEVLRFARKKNITNLGTFLTFASKKSIAIGTLLKFATTKSSHLVTLLTFATKKHHRPSNISQICKCNKPNKRETKSYNRNE